MKQILLLIALLPLISMLGCSVVSSHSHSRVEGTKIGPETISRIEIGETTKSWMISALGTPDSASKTEGGELLRYSSKRIRKSHGHLLFVFDTSSESVEKETYFFEFKDGKLLRYWREEA